MAKLRQWASAAQAHKALVLETATLFRISAVLGVFADLRQFLASQSGAREERTWLLRPRQFPPFFGRPPLKILSGSFDDQMSVRQHLTSLLSGQASINAIDWDLTPAEKGKIIWDDGSRGNIRAVCFDGFGTVVEIRDKRWPFRALLKRQPSDADLVRALTQPIGLRELSQTVGAPNDEEVLARLEADLLAECASTRQRPGMGLVWAALKRAELKIAICSNLASPYENALLSNLPGTADALLLSFQVGLMKPQREIYERVFEQLGLTPSQVLFVGDSLEADVLGPQSAGALAMPIAEFEASYATRVSFYAPRKVAELFERIAATKPR